MAYSRGPVVHVNHSASLLPGNLAVVLGTGGSGSVTYAIAHKSCAALAHVATGTCRQTLVDRGNGDGVSKLPLMQARWCRLRCNVCLLVLVAYKAFEVWEWNGSNVTLLYVEELNGHAGKMEDVCFARGIGSIGNAVCIGTSEGNLKVYDLAPKTPSTSESSRLKFLRLLEGHGSAVCDVASNAQGELASCYEDGSIVIWTDPLTSVESSLVVREESGSPCLSLCFWETSLIGGYADGSVRLYSADSGDKMAEIAAHARSVLALDTAFESGLLLSVSEDSTATVWRLPTDREPKISHVFTTSMPNSLLCGGRFLDPRGGNFALSSYDSSDIFTFSRSSHT